MMIQKAPKIIVFGNHELNINNQMILRLNNYYCGKLVKILKYEKICQKSILKDNLALVNIYEYYFTNENEIRVLDYSIARLVNRYGDFIS